MYGFPTPKIICWTLTPQCDGAWRYGLQRGLGHKGRAPMNGFSAFIGRDNKDDHLPNM